MNIHNTRRRAYSNELFAFETNVTCILRHLEWKERLNQFQRVSISQLSLLLCVMEHTVLHCHNNGVLSIRLHINPFHLFRFAIFLSLFLFLFISPFILLVRSICIAYNSDFCVNILIANILYKFHFSAS